ncbi:hypothetical protein DSECCO2_571860 [anaerobic digester metagenome]
MGIGQGHVPQGQLPRGVAGQGVGRVCHKACPGGLRAVQQCAPVQPHERGGHEAHGREHGIAPAQMVGHGQRGQVCGLRFLPQEACGLVGDHQHVLAPAVAKGGLQPLFGQEVLGQRLYGAARLADGHHKGLFRRQAGEPRFHGARVHVVGYPQPRPVMAGPVLLRKERPLQRPCAQRGTANAQQHHVAVAGKGGLQRGKARLQRGAVGHVDERQVPGGQFRLQAVGHLALVQIVGGGGVGGQAAQRRGGPGVGPVEAMGLGHGHAPCGPEKRPMACVPVMRGVAERGAT